MDSFYIFLSRAYVIVNQSDQLDKVVFLVLSHMDRFESEQPVADVNDVCSNRVYYDLKLVIIRHRIGRDVSERLEIICRAQVQVRIELVQQTADGHPHAFVFANRITVVRDLLSIGHLAAGPEPMLVTERHVDRHVSHQGRGHGGQKLLLEQDQFPRAEHPFRLCQTVDVRQPVGRRVPIDADVGRQHFTQTLGPVGRDVVQVQQTRIEVALVDLESFGGAGRFPDDRGQLSGNVQFQLFARPQNAGQVPPAAADLQVPVQIALHEIHGTYGFPVLRRIGRRVGEQIQQPQPPGRGLRPAMGHEQHARNKRSVPDRKVLQARVAVCEHRAHSQQMIARIVAASALEPVHGPVTTAASVHQRDQYHESKRNHRRLLFFMIFHLWPTEFERQMWLTEQFIL